MEAESVGAVVGENLERLRKRARMTQHEAARLFARRGAPLSRSKIAAIEAGERPNLAFADVLVMAHTFNVEVAELFDGHGPVAIAEHVVLSRPVIRGLLRGTNVPEGSVSWDPQTHHAELLRIADVRAEGDAVTVGQFHLVDADHALAQRLNVAPQIVVDIALQIWGNTLTEERDARVARFGAIDLGERHAHRGHITRELSQEIEAEITRQGLISHPEVENKEEE